MAMGIRAVMEAVAKKIMKNREVEFLDFFTSFLEFWSSMQIKF